MTAGRWAGVLPLLALVLCQPLRAQGLAAGKLLVASREVADPNFAQTVVLLTRYGRGGAMGLILNRPSDIPLSAALEGMVQAKGRNDTVYVGGPVGRSGALALLRARAAPSGAARVLDGLFLISNRAGLAEALKTGVTSGSLRVYVGYAGWRPGRLEAEVAQRMWHVVAGTAGAVFDPYPGSLWRRLIPGAEPKLARLQ
jgi:putative transcriptional regulator